MNMTSATDEIAALKKALASAKSELILVRTERDLLKERLNKFMRKIFCAKSEVSSQSQKDMFFNEAEGLGVQTQPAQQDEVQPDADGATTIDVPAHQRVKRGRKPLDPTLPRTVVRHELPESERICPHDGAALKEIGVEASEQLDIIPQQVRVIRHERVKYACPCCDGTLRLAAKPAQVIPKGLFSEGLLAWVISSKYCDGLPLYRQAALLGRFGGSDLSRNTLAASVVCVGQAVQPIINLLRDHLLDAPVTHGDETQIQVLKEPGKSAQSKSYMWVQMTQGSGADGTGPPIRLFAYAASRSTAAAQILYAGMRPGAVLMTDGYAVYDQIASAHQLVHLGCWAHCRRDFNDALQALHEKYGGRGLLVLAVPSNDFAQELEDEAAVKQYCAVNFDLTLPMTEITHVKGAEAHPFYTWMLATYGFSPNWNFNKILLGPDGTVVDMWRAGTAPESARIVDEIEALLP